MKWFEKMDYPIILKLLNIFRSAVDDETATKKQTKKVKISKTTPTVFLLISPKRQKLSDCGFHQ
jgi:hypothetical protein